MLVDHQRSMPVKAVAGIGHGAGQRECFLGRHEAGAGHQKSANLHRRVTIGRDISDDGSDLAVAENIAADLAPDGLQAAGRLGLRDQDALAFG